MSARFSLLSLFIISFCCFSLSAGKERLAGEKGGGRSKVEVQMEGRGRDEWRRERGGEGEERR